MPIITPEYNLYNWSDLNFPTIEPSLKLDFANARALDPRITFTRALPAATYVSRDGLIKTAGINEPRFDHDPTTGESLGLLIEEERTNLLSYSDLTSGASGSWWENGGLTTSQGSNVTAPDGTLTAWNTVYNGASGDGNLYRGGGEVTTTNSTSYTISVWAKVPSTNTYITGVRIRTFNVDHSVNFNLLTGSFISSTEGSPTSYSIIPYPNGWYRCSMTFTSGTDGNQGVQFYLITSTGSTALNSSGANGEEIYMWGAQLEEGSFPTSYIPTSTSTATRADEYGYTSNMDFYNQSEGSVFSEVSLLDVGNSAGKVIWSFNQVGGFGEGFYMSNENGGQGITHILYDNSVNQYSRAVVSSASANQFYKTIYSQQTNNVNSASNGSVGTDDTSATLPTIERLVIGNNAWGTDAGGSNVLNPGNCHIKSFIYYPKRLTNTQLQTLTQ